MVKTGFSDVAKMDEREVWKMYKKSQLDRRSLVKCKWVCLWKRDGTARARRVAKGFSEVSYVDYDPMGIYAPVINDVTFRIMMVIKMLLNLSTFTFDVETEFLLE